MAQVSQLHALASRFIETESLPWIATAPGSKMKVIYHDPRTEMLTILAKLEPGAGIPPHVHEDLEQTFVLEGSLLDDEGECTAGNFVIRAKGSRHARPRAAPCWYSSSNPRRRSRRFCSRMLQQAAGSLDAPSPSPRRPRGSGVPYSRGRCSWVPAFAGTTAYGLISRISL